jgi:SAM-dependent MidA family methyltransferase
VTALAAALVRRIAEAGPISVAEYMAAANAHYYATRDPLGAAGDFTTAPEISQMFGELVGVWLVDLWQRAAPAGPVHYVELGPGRGTLAADALRVLHRARLQPSVHLIETSPVLRAAQAEALPGACWHDAVDTLPTQGALLIVANEFFDALPIRQHVRTPAGWNERLVQATANGFAPVPGREDTGDEVPAALRDSPVGSLFESSPASLAITRTLATRLAAQGGAMLVVDYGHGRTAIGETLQAVRRHAPAPVFADPGEHDLTAHVDFDALGRAARCAGAVVRGPQTQGEWLTTMGIAMRAAALARADPGRAAQVHGDLERLVGAEAMGRLFKAMGVHAPAWPQPGGF